MINVSFKCFPYTYKIFILSLKNKLHQGGTKKICLVNKNCSTYNVFHFSRKISSIKICYNCQRGWICGPWSVYKTPRFSFELKLTEFQHLPGVQQRPGLLGEDPQLAKQILALPANAAGRELLLPGAVLRLLRAPLDRPCGVREVPRGRHPDEGKVRGSRVSGLHVRGLLRQLCRHARKTSGSFTLHSKF